MGEGEKAAGMPRLGVTSGGHLCTVGEGISPKTRAEDLSLIFPLCPLCEVVYPPIQAPLTTIEVKTSPQMLYRVEWCGPISLFTHGRGHAACMGDIINTSNPLTTAASPRATCSHINISVLASGRQCLALERCVSRGVSSCCIYVGEPSNSSDVPYVTGA